MESSNVSDFGDAWVSDPHSQSQACSIYDMNGDGILEYYGMYSTFTGKWTGWVSCSSTGVFPCNNGGPLKYDCVHRPLLGNPSNYDCIPTQGGAYSSLQACQNAPCPPPDKPCEECCGKLKKG